MITFRKIVRESIFVDDFNPFTKNNIVEFSGSGIAVIYGPNGIGKTSFVSVLKDQASTSVEYDVDDMVFTSGSQTFHVINDQNNRNVIHGETNDFLLGDDISREFKLEHEIEDGYKKYLDSCADVLKNSFKITSGSSPLLNFIADERVKEIVAEIAKTSRRGINCKNPQALELLAGIPIEEISLTDEQKSKIDFLRSDYLKNDKSIIVQVEALSKQHVVTNPEILEIEETTEAITILNRFKHKTQCIVCDTPNIDTEALLAKKTQQKLRVLSPLSDKQKSLIEQVIKLVPDEDPFAIRNSLFESLDQGDSSIISILIENFNETKGIYIRQLLSEISSLTNSCNLIELMKELADLQAGQPELTDEDLVFIEEIIGNSMNHMLKVSRNSDKKFRITLDDKPFLGEDRESLRLSTGEQNFLSLSFEFLRAKNSTKEFVIIDDPISSFDSIYKNRIAYALMRMLRGKKRIVLTHNLDLIRLLDAQQKGCYKLYLLNNTEGGVNGFVPLNSTEKKMLIDLSALLNTFRNDIFSSITNPQLFLLSLIPFMRGYACIIGYRGCYEELTTLMHGYRTESIDLAAIYEKLFASNNPIVAASYVVSVPVMLEMEIDSSLQILDCTKYPLLNKTLRHSLEYLFLRLFVEKGLINRFPDLVVTEKMQLGEIIAAAFPEIDHPSTQEEKAHAKWQMRNRVFFTSKKTLINEFNHFEGNLNIFQPAIDISDQALEKERIDILEFMNSL